MIINNSNNYEIIINKHLISSKYYFILSVTNNINTENKLYLKYNFIEEEGNIIFDNINTYFTISYLNKFTFPIFNESNSKTNSHKQRSRGFHLLRLLFASLFTIILLFQMF